MIDKTELISKITDLMPKKEGVIIDKELHSDLINLINSIEDKPVCPMQPITPMYPMYPIYIEYPSYPTYPTYKVEYTIGVRMDDPDIKYNV